jgi:hypothetical protein
MDSKMESNDTVIKPSGCWMFIVAILFGLVYVRSLAFVFVDGDDATSIAYHLLGRNPNLQPTYASYQGMMDVILGLIPADQVLLKYIPLGITSASAVLMAILLLTLVFEWSGLGYRPAIYYVLVSAAVLLSVPEFFYFGLVFMPTMVAMCLVLVAHLLLRRGCDPRVGANYRILLVAVSLVAFGFGVSFRWNIGAYAGVVVVDMWVNGLQREKSLSKRLLLGLGWGVLALVASVVMIKLSGYGIAGLVDSFPTIQRMFNQAGAHSLNSQVGWGEILLHFSLATASELTPAFVLFAVLGFMILVYRRDRVWMVVAVGLLGILPWLRTGGLKYLIVSLPGLVYCYVVGFTSLLDHLNQNRFRLYQYLAIIFLIGIPWVVGVHITRAGSAWGPAFELRPPDADANPADLQMEFVFDSGAAFPVPGGFRPLYGHAYVLFGGDWKNLAVSMDMERRAALDSAISLDVPLVVTAWSPDYYLNYLYALGFTTSDAADRPGEDVIFYERRFRNPDGRQLTLLYSEVEGDELLDVVQHLNSLLATQSQVVLVGYSSSMRMLYEQNPNALTVLGPTSAILDPALIRPDVPVTPDTTITPVPLDDYLANPGIGWQSDGNSHSDQFLPETVAYAFRLDITWDILNPAEGVYDWEPFDTLLEKAVAEGKQFSFRVFTMTGDFYGGHNVPDWVLEKGAVILPAGDPDYSNCVYQAEWGNFVNALLRRYDGNPNIAFMDISGYGDYNEWGWVDQTDWDFVWEMNYNAGTAAPYTMETLDSQARRRLADMFLGGAFDSHQCSDGSGQVQTVSYAYDGGKETQLVMPTAGTIQTLQYALLRRTDVGIRYDCLGRDDGGLTPYAAAIWRHAPVVFELCSPEQFDLAIAQKDLQITHGSVVHNNGYELGRTELQQVMKNVGYRYVLKQAEFNSRSYGGGGLNLVMLWRNVGSAPSYPRMGQNFQLHVYLVDEAEDKVVVDFPVATDISTWLPAELTAMDPPDHRVDLSLIVPEETHPGGYALKVAIVDLMTGKPIRLAFDGADEDGRYFLGNMEIVY